LIANNFESLALAASAAALSLATKVLAPRIAAGLAALGMGQAAFAIVILFSFSERKGSSALCASNVQVWHGLLP
jgi:hypothetical protein